MADVQTVIRRQINASAATVFDAVAHIENFSEAVPGITGVEFLTDRTRGARTRFRETRVIRGREASTELEVTEYEPDSHVRLVSDQGGTVWDTVFTITPDGSGSHLSMVMDARPHTLMAKVTTPLFKRVIARAIESDMDAVKQYCEAGAGS